MTKYAGGNGGGGVPSPTLVKPQPSQSVDDQSVMELQSSLLLLSIYEARAGSIATVASSLIQVSSIFFAGFVFFLFEAKADGIWLGLAFCISLVGALLNASALFVLLQTSKADKVREVPNRELDSVLDEKLYYLLESAGSLRLGKSLLAASFVCMLLTLGLWASPRLVLTAHQLGSLVEKPGGGP